MLVDLHNVILLELDARIDANGNIEVDGPHPEGEFVSFQNQRF